MCCMHTRIRSVRRSLHQTANAVQKIMSGVCQQPRLKLRRRVLMVDRRTPARGQPWSTLVDAGAWILLTVVSVLNCSRVKISRRPGENDAGGVLGRMTGIDDEEHAFVSLTAFSIFKQRMANEVAQLQTTL